jgi:glycosyltransferase involved in cell wall biosynthesis
MDLTVAMITLNEEAAVSTVVGSIRQVVPDAEILVVDSSTDRTAEIAESMGARVIKQFPPIGYGPAMDLALRSGSGSVIITMDCDDTYPSEMIPTLRDMVLRDGYDVVDGNRLARKPQAMAWPNYIGNWLLAAFASVLFGTRLQDLHSGMRAYRSSMLRELRYQPRGAALPVELLLRPIRQGFRVTTVPIDYRFRVGDSTMKPLETIKWSLRRIGRVRFGGGQA